MHLNKHRIIINWYFSLAKVKLFSTCLIRCQSCLIIVSVRSFGLCCLEQQAENKGLFESRSALVRLGVTAAPTKHNSNISLKNTAEVFLFVCFYETYLTRVYFNCTQMIYVSINLQTRVHIYIYI